MNKIECAYCGKLIDYDRSYDSDPLLDKYMYSEETCHNRLCPECNKITEQFRKEFAEKIEPQIEKLVREISNK